MQKDRGKREEKREGMRGSQMKGRERDNRKKMSYQKWLEEGGRHKDREIR